MDLSHKQWMYGGAVLLAATSGTIALGGVPNVWTPMPLPIVIVAFIAMIVFPFVTPALYLLVLKLSSSSIHFGKIILALVVFFGVLNIIYFQSAWEYGIKYQGPEHTKIVASENLVGFTVALAISVVALAKKSRPLAYAANFLLFMLLSWCAFPYLGELP
ncbi:MAG: hypothetical protein HWE11_14250 [Gammaproteobacteria bacterium]|nr:hypothetical protein [Gammaproteobacteria bacterium]